MTTPESKENESPQQKNQEKLQALCDAIKRKLPLDTLTDSSTSKFRDFIENLGKKGIKQEELKCIIRAYNYFNQLMQMHLPETPQTPQTPQTPEASGKSIEATS